MEEKGPANNKIANYIKMNFVENLNPELGNIRFRNININKEGSLQIYNELKNKDDFIITIDDCKFTCDLSLIIRLVQEANVVKLIIFPSIKCSFADKIEIIKINNKLKMLSITVKFNSASKVNEFFNVLAINKTIKTFDIILLVNFSKYSKCELQKAMENMLKNNKEIEKMNVRIMISSRGSKECFNCFVETFIECNTFNNTMTKLDIYIEYDIGPEPDLSLLSDMIKTNTSLRELKICISPDKYLDTLNSIIDGLKENGSLTILKIYCIQINIKDRCPEKFTEIEELLERNRQPMVKSAGKR